MNATDFSTGDKSQLEKASGTYGDYKIYATVEWADGKIRNMNGNMDKEHENIGYFNLSEQFSLSFNGSTDLELLNTQCNAIISFIDDVRNSIKLNNN